MRKKKDIGNELTELELKKLEKRIYKVYSEAQKEVEGEMGDFLAQFQKENKVWQKELKEGSKTDEQYSKWLQEEMFKGKRWKAKNESLANTLYNFNKAAANLINGTMPGVFQINANYTAFNLENMAGVNFGFDIYNEAAVREILVKDRRLLPSKKLDKAKDIRWNFISIKNEVAKGITNGKSAEDIARRLSKVIPNRNMAQLTTHARTMVTSAQNQGRLYRLHEAKKKGLNVKKRWLATLDNRTRYGHAILDGQEKDLDEPFIAEGYELMEPGDPTAHPSLVYNCRCRLENVLVDYPDDEFTERRDNETGELIKNMNYKEWYKMKTGEELGPDNTPLKKTQNKPPKVKKAKETPAAAPAKPAKAKPKTPTPTPAEPVFDDFRDLRSANKIRAKMDELGARPEFDAIVEKYGSDSFAPAATVWGSYLNDKDPRITKEFTALFKKIAKPAGKTAAEKVETVKAAKEAKKKAEKIIKGSTLDHYQDAVDRVIKAKAQNMTAAQIKAEKTIAKKMDKMVNKLIEENDFRMRVPGDNGSVLKKIFESGRFKTQMETGSTSEAAIFDPGYRKQISKTLFGTKDIADSKFEKYGYLGSKDLATDISKDYMNDYGSAIITFKKDHLKDRTTMSFGDSLLTLDFDDNFAPSKVNAFNSYIGYSKGMGGEFSEFYEQMKKSFDDFPDPQDIAGDLRIGFFELQYHDDLTIDDIESITLGKKTIYELAQNADIVKKIKEKGIKIFYKSGKEIKQWKP